MILKVVVLLLIISTTLLIHYVVFPIIRSEVPLFLELLLDVFVCAFISFCALKYHI